MRKWISILLCLTLLILPAAHAEVSSDPVISERNAPLRILNQLYTGQNTLVFSPLSLSAALHMAAEGASGETRTQLDAFLMDSRPEWDILEDLRFSGVTMANVAFLRPDFVLLESYEDVLSDIYDASPEQMVPGNVMNQVNDWVSDQTDGLIPALLSQEPSDDTVLLLINALTMKSEWASPFSAAQTGFSVFHSPDGDIEVSCMHQCSPFAYSHVNGIQAVSLPYQNSVLQLTVLLPEDGDLSSLINQLCAAPDEFIARHMPIESAMVNLSLPNVHAESSFELKDYLSALGVTDAFDPEAADFSAMAENAQQLQLHIGSVLQKAVLNVNESGTEAAAATQVAMLERGAMVQDIVEMNVDRPFLMLINDPDTGYVLFAACINNPA